MRDLHTHVMERHQALKRERSHYIDEWRDMSDYVLGARGRWLLSKNQKVSERRNPRMYNEQAKFAVNTLASGMMAGITSPARPWFNLTLADRDMTEYGPVKNWLDDVKNIVQEVFSRSNFYNSVHSMYLELGTFGTASMGAYEHFDNVVRFETYTAGSYCLDTNGEREVDTFYHDCKLTVYQMVSRFGLENVSREVRQMYERGHYETKIDVVHAVEPNNNRRFDSPLAKDMPWRSVYYEESSSKMDKPLLLSGFEDNPIMSPRWEVVAEDVYASSYPGIDSINTNKSLQIEEWDKALAIEKMHNPPLVGDAGIDAAGVDLLAGGITFVPNMAAMSGHGLKSVYDVNMRIQDLKEDIVLKEQRIQRAFYADLFMMITEMDRRQITATEIAARQEEKLLMLGPVLERLNNELLSPVIDRTYNIAYRAGIIPPPPPELEGQEMNVEFISTLAQAQKAVATASMETTAAFALNMAAVSPSVMDKLDTDQMIDEYARAKGVPPKTVRSDEDVATMREQRAAQQQQQMMMEQAGNLAQSAKSLSETDMSADSALSRMVGAAQ